jgi:hypothetical protein
MCRLPIIEYEPRLQRMRNERVKENQTVNWLSEFQRCSSYNFFVLVYHNFELSCSNINKLLCTIHILVGYKCCPLLSPGHPPIITKCSGFFHMGSLCKSIIWLFRWLINKSVNSCKNCKQTPINTRHKRMQVEITNQLSLLRSRKYYFVQMSQHCINCIKSASNTIHRTTLTSGTEM